MRNIDNRFICHMNDVRPETLSVRGSYKVYLLVLESEAKSWLDCHGSKPYPAGVGLLIIGMDRIISGHVSLSAPCLLSVTIQRRESYGGSRSVGWKGEGGV